MKKRILIALLCLPAIALAQQLPTKEPAKPAAAPAKPAASAPAATGPVATVKFPCRVHEGFHGIWVPGSALSD